MRWQTSQVFRAPFAGRDLFQRSARRTGGAAATGIGTGTSAGAGIDPVTGIAATPDPRGNQQAATIVRESPPMSPVLWMLLETVGSLFAAACMLRAYAWRCHLNPNNPLSQFVNALTEWLVKPLSKLVRPTRNWNWPALIAALLVALLVAVLFFVLQGARPMPGLPGPISANSTAGAPSRAATPSTC